MQILIISFFIILGILYIISRRYQAELIQTLNFKEHPLRKFYCIIAYIHGVLLKKEENLSRKARIRIYRYSTITLFSICCFLLLLFLYQSIMVKKSYVITDYRMTRPQFGEGNKKLTAVYISDLGKQELDILISEKILNEKEKNSKFLLAKKWIEERMPGQNQSLQMITKNLYFPVRIPKTPIIVSCSTNRPDLIEQNGTIHPDHADENGSHITIQVKLMYEEDIRTFFYYVLLYPRPQSPDIQLKNQIENQIMMQNEETRQEDQLILPKEVGEHSIVWKTKEEDQSFQLFLLGVFAIAIIPVLLVQKEKEKNQRYMEELIGEYSEIVSKFRLLLAAGMTTKGAWSRIVSDYIIKSARINDNYNKKKGWFHYKKKRFCQAAYEEMLITRREQENGIPEEVTYENFGKRCKAVIYIRFTSILSQNLKMGSRQIGFLLEQESRTAFEDRKQYVLQKGEKASTKLIGPTMVMLLVVLGIILVPAFRSF